MKEKNGKNYYYFFGKEVLMFTKEKVKKAVNVAIIDVLLAFAIFAVALVGRYSGQLEDETIRSAEYEQKALDWQTKAEDLQIKLARAEADLQSCSEKIEELETLNYIISEEMSMLEENEEYLEEISEYVYNGEWNYYYDYEDVEILAGVMYGENWISGRYEMMLTGSVVLNRVLDERFPNNIHDVVYQIDGGYEQYAPRTKRLIGSSEVPEICYDLARILLDYGPIAPPDVVYQAHFNQGTVFWEYKGEQFCYG